MAVFQAVRKNWLKLDDNDISNISSVSSGIVEVKCSDNVKAFILTDTSLRWPTFCDPIQIGSNDKNIFYQLTSKTHKIRFNETLNLLRNGHHVIGTGLSGIGKSSEMNAYLIRFMKNIGEDGWPPEVWYRF